MRAWHLKQQGWTRRLIAGALGVTEGAVSHGLAAAEGQGPEALRTRPRGRVVRGTARLKPRLIRVFIQEFFRVYPEHGRFDWSRLDPYMDALARTGAKVVAAVAIKPKPLFPAVDPAVWRPNDVAEWQRVIAALVRRYSVDRPLVTRAPSAPVLRC